MGDHGTFDHPHRTGLLLLAAGAGLAAPAGAAVPPPDASSQTVFARVAEGDVTGVAVTAGGAR